MAALFDAVRDSVTALQAAEAYGLNVTRYGKTRCVWHDDKNPSLSFNAKTGKCKCFVCGSGGSSIDFTAQLYGITPTEAAQRLAKDFHILPTLDREIVPKGPSRAQIRRDAEEWARQRWSYLCEVEREAREVLHKFSASDETWRNPVFTRALKALGAVQIELERLWVADIEDINAMQQEVKNDGRCA